MNIIIIKKTTFSLIGVFFFLSCCPALAEIYRYVDENGIWHFTNIRSDSRYKLYLPSSSQNSDTIITEFGYIIDQAAEKFDIEDSLIKAVIKAESDFNYKAVSKTGAQGLMQLMPGTADAMDVKNPFSPEENIFGGTKYLSLLLERYDNNKTKAIAAYNAGPANVDTHNGIPPFPETEAFVKRVFTYYNEYVSQGE
jgi:soluble lytic murein transglycosylase